MGVIRAVGLIFFLTILVGGCIMANSDSHQVEIANSNATEISWEAAVDYLQTGLVVSMEEGDLVLILHLENGTDATVTFPAESVIMEAFARCGTVCDSVKWLSS